MELTFSKFTVSKFADIISAANFFIHNEELYGSNSFNYLCKILEDNDCSYLITEATYISETYLQEYEYYYCTEFKSNQKCTQRIHFFKSSKSIDKLNNQNKFYDFFINCKTKLLDSDYLGYMVIKPVANSYWGVTMLDSKLFRTKEKPFINSTIVDTVHILNHKFTIHTLPFQKQDSAISECARASIWSCLYYSHKKFRKDYFSVVSLNRILQEESSNIGSQKEGSVYLGLNVLQIDKIVTRFGLRLHSFSFEDIFINKNSLVPNTPEFKTSSDTLVDERNEQMCINQETINEFLDMIYAYNRSGIPLMLGCKILGKADKSIHIDPNNCYHLVTIVGYQTQWIKDVESIQEIYIHDDQFGPFSKIIEFEDPHYSAGKDYKNKIFKAQEIGDDFIAMYPTHLYIPLPKDITIHYKDIVEFRTVFLYAIRLFYSKSYRNKIENPDSIIEEDAPTMASKNYLIKGSKYKSKLIIQLLKLKKDAIAAAKPEDKIFYDYLLKRLAQLALPRFVWIIELYHLDKKFCNILVDPSCVKNSFSFIDLIILDSDLGKLVTSRDDDFNKRLILGMFSGNVLQDIPNTILNSIKKFILFRIQNYKEDFSTEYRKFYPLKNYKFNYPTIEVAELVDYFTQLKKQGKNLRFFSDVLENQFKNIGTDITFPIFAQNIIKMYVNVHSKENNLLYGIEGKKETKIFELLN